MSKGKLKVRPRWRRNTGTRLHRRGTQSIVLAAIAHTLYNVLVFSPNGAQFAAKGVLRVALWAVLAYVLFRYWPVPPQATLGAVATAANPEPAT
jgi:hypothetical protein